MERYTVGPRVRKSRFGAVARIVGSRPESFLIGVYLCARGGQAHGVTVTLDLARYQVMARALSFTTVAMLYIPRLMVALGHSRGHWDCARPSNSIDPMERLLHEVCPGRSYFTPWNTLEVAEAAILSHRLPVVVGS